MQHLSEWVDANHEEDSDRVQFVELEASAGVCRHSKLHLRVDNLHLLHDDAPPSLTANGHFSGVQRQIELVSLHNHNTNHQSASEKPRLHTKQDETRIASDLNAQVSSELMHHKMQEAMGHPDRELYVEIRSDTSKDTDSSASTPMKPTDPINDQLIQQLQAEIARLRAENQAKTLQIEQLLSTKRFQPSPIKPPSSLITVTVESNTCEIVDQSFDKILEEIQEEIHAMLANEDDTDEQSIVISVID